MSVRIFTETRGSGNGGGPAVNRPRTFDHPSDAAYVPENAAISACGRLNFGLAF